MYRVLQKWYGKSWNKLAVIAKNVCCKSFGNSRFLRVYGKQLRDLYSIYGKSIRYISSQIFKIYSTDVIQNGSPSHPLSA